MLRALSASGARLAGSRSLGPAPVLGLSPLQMREAAPPQSQSVVISVFAVQIRLMSTKRERMEHPKLKRFKPITPGVRHLVQIDRSELWKGDPVKALTSGKGNFSRGGRNNTGKITVRHRGGGVKQLYRQIDFKRQVLDTRGVIQRLEYDPNRTAYIALVKYVSTGQLSYILAPQGMKPGDEVYASRTSELDIKPGYAMPLRYIPVGTFVHNVELRPGRGGQMARSAGTAVQVYDKAGKPGYCTIVQASKEQRLVHLDCMATIGQVSNEFNRLRKLGKAGRSRWMGWRPSVRGVAMNPIDHPHGGGQGKTSGGRPSSTPWGRYTKGPKTRKMPHKPWILLPSGEVRKQAKAVGVVHAKGGGGGGGAGAGGKKK